MNYTEHAFRSWLNARHKDIYKRFPLTTIKIDGNIHAWMSPTVDKLWREFTGLPINEYKEY